MKPEQISHLAGMLDDARVSRHSVERLTLAVPDLSIPAAYAIQAAGIRLRMQGNEHVIGLKVGLTSEAKRRQMDLDEPCYGVLTDQMQVPDGGTLPVKSGIHPKIEPEVALRIARTLRGNVTLEEVAQACSGVASAVEVLDSRFRDFKYFSLPDVVADNSSSFMFAVSETWHPLTGLELDKLQMVMSINGTPRQSALSSAISGNPLISVVELCRLLHKEGKEVPEGSIVLTGAATVAEQLTPGDRVSLTVAGLSPVSLTAS